MNKPVWRMNTGNGVPSDFGGSVFITEFGVCDSPSRTYKDFHFHIIGNDLNILAYQTTRTKAAKYGKSTCGFCGGAGSYVDITSLCSNKCPDCNGKGYTLERIR